MRGIGGDEEGEVVEVEGGGWGDEERSDWGGWRLGGQPFIEFNRARGPVGGALPDIVEPKEADVVEDEESECRERVVDRALFLVDTRFVPLQINARNISLSFPPFSLH
jgi:hypothetical protein